jgi:RNA polymerase sigma factor (TIGR02999 family)
MRDVLVDEARRKIATKRGGDLWRVALQDDEHPASASPEEMILLDLTLQKLERVYPDEYRIVMLRYFTGLTEEEIAETLGIGRRTVQRRWRFSRAWLAEELDHGS